MQIETPQAVAIYCRLSKEDLDENKIDNLSRSIQNQKSMLTDFAEINGWQIFDIYCDDNLSGVARDRPEFNRLIRDASLRKFNIILCKNQSRFTRDMQLVEKYIHGLFPIWGIRFVGMVDGADTSVKGNKKARQINGLVNQWYLENLSDNIKATLKLKRIRGKYTGSVLPYGYRPDPDDINCFIIDPVAASVVRRIWEMHAGGIGAPTIARTLNEEGIPNPTSYAKLTGYSWHNRPSSSLWSAGCIYSILHNETYLGTLCQGRQLTPEGQFHSKKNIPKDQWVRTVGHHPAIIDDELLRRELKARKEAGAHNLHEQKKNFPPGIFGKEVRCASCGKILTKGKTLRKTGYERTLFCPTRKKSPSHCKGAFISEKHLESAILHELKNLADRYSDDRVQIGICQDAQSADLIQERNRLKTAVELIEKEITAYEQRSRDLYLKEDWIRVIGTHEAIISLETWNQTQALLAVGARSFTRSEEIGLFSRKVYCGHCNKLMRTGRSKRKSGTYYNYVICVRRHPEINPCPVHAVSNALMEKTILDQLDILAAKYKDGSLFSEIMDEESTIGIEIKRLKAELAQHKKKLVEYETGLKCLYLDKASGSISNSDYQFLSRELSAGKELAERKVDLCTENYNKILRSQEILREKAGVLESYSRPKELTRSMVETFIDHIVICSSSDGTSKQEIKIYWNF